MTYRSVRVIVGAFIATACLGCLAGAMREVLWGSGALALKLAVGAWASVILAAAALGVDSVTARPVPSPNGSRSR